MSVSVAAAEPGWFALTVRPRSEKAVATALELRNLQGFLPLYGCKRRWSDRVKIVEMPLFTGYVFCRFTGGERLRVLATPGVTSVVGFDGRDTPVPEAEIQVIQKLLASGYPVEPWQYLRVGESVRIEDGPLAGVHGTLQREKSLLRVVVNVEVLRRSIAVEIDRSVLTAIRPDPQSHSASGRP